MNAWLTSARARGRRRRDPDVVGRRRELVRRLAPGRSFADIGGMWGIHGQIAFLAEEAGADPVVLLDAMEPGERYRSEHARRSSAVRFVRADLDDPAIASHGRYDVVWCTGVVYHSPSPLAQLRNLRRITDGELLLGSHVIPEVPGIDSACIWYPGLGEGGRNAFRRAHGGDQAPRAIGVTEPFDPAPEMEHANWWWGITPSALRSMLAVAGFEVVEEMTYTSFLLDLLVRPVDR
jgi:hypothetical protein